MVAEVSFPYLFLVLYSTDMNYDSCMYADLVQ